MTHLFIINPAAGSKNRTAEFTQIIQHECKKRQLAYRIAVSGQPGDITRIAREAAESGETYRIYACGGDGTLNEVVQGTAGFENVAVTVFSGGSGNDFIKIFDDPQAFHQLPRLLDAEETEFDLIDCNGRYSLNICSVGLDARIGLDVARYKRLPLLHGFAAYAVSTVVNVIKGIAEHYIIEIDGQRIDSEQTMVCVCNGRYYGGGFNPVPEADPADGLLDVLLVKKVSRLQVASVVGKYKNGLYAMLPELVRHIQTKALHIICDKPTAIQLDGEVLTDRQFSIGISQKKLRFFYPKSLSWQRNIPAQAHQ